MMSPTNIGEQRSIISTLLPKRSLAVRGAENLHDELAGNDIQLFDSDGSDDDDDDDPPMVAAVNDFSATTEVTLFSLSLSSSSSSSSSSESLGVSLPSSFDCTFPPPTIHIVRDYVHPSDLDDEDGIDDDHDDDEHKMEDLHEPTNDNLTAAPVTSNPYAQLLFDATHNTLVTTMEVCLAGGFVRRLTRGIPLPPEMMLISDDSSDESSTYSSGSRQSNSNDQADVACQGELQRQIPVHDSGGQSIPISKGTDQQQQQEQDEQQGQQEWYHISFYWMDADYEVGCWDEESDTQLYLLHDLGDPWVSTTISARRPCCSRHRRGYCRGSVGCGDTLMKLFSSASSCVASSSSSSTTTSHHGHHTLARSPQLHGRRDNHFNHTTDATTAFHPNSRFMNQFGYQVLSN